VHHDEQQKIAQFLAKICVVLGAERPDYFVSLFDQRREQRVVGLLAIPGAPARGAQLCDNAAKLPEVIGS
jgi:hypothetical protein